MISCFHFGFQLYYYQTYNERFSIMDVQYDEFTVVCEDCDWTCDMLKTSETNPHRCPKCGGDLYYSGTDELYID